MGDFGTSGEGQYSVDEAQQIRIDFSKCVREMQDDVTATTQSNKL